MMDDSARKTWMPVLRTEGPVTRAWHVGMTPLQLIAMGSRVAPAPQVTKAMAKYAQVGSNVSFRCVDFFQNNIRTKLARCVLFDE